MYCPFKIPSTLYFLVIQLLLVKQCVSFLPASIHTTYRSMQIVCMQREGYVTERLKLFDLPKVIQMASDEFRPNCKSPQEWMALHYNIIILFCDKFLFPDKMAHSVIGIKDLKRNALVGFVDLSLQTSDGSLDALRPLSLKDRMTQHKGKLAPYLCNLLIVPEYRRKGLATELVNACVDEAQRWGHSSICLHVDPTCNAALSLYIRNGFMPQRKVGDTMFMKRITRIWPTA
jgi:ribosomal protein S18 acetylase RimI-like enzyme